ncbi:flagellar P-ring protein precursor FlgI [Thermosulfidibacter takaii ABI70S6]|uniref:Flagellar P-ring protein n=1 Tax=Thermosulfidibacter takaii (strain DSM 17441 / JCM 13301 / NBRC 103674 / ABI70S6) TaxID=1298851 RepID=A0A0S3QST6_THET7|nr:flagellar basal body P-ring protein FlgI [Thermosulfidibacter takaii]BAT71405.1 flagellar P-ring protein precursor FlgI [Thermosulfidibacter takaii ABI70S6]
MRKVLVALVIIVAFAAEGLGARIKDITSVEGIRENLLVGYGLVVGLDDTGDDTKMYYQSISNMLERLGIHVPVDKVDVGNVAAVIVTAKLPPFAKPGMKIDVDVASIGDADSLQGGTLIMTPLFGPDGKIYAVAQGPISIGGFNARGGGQRIQKNHPTAGRIPNGAIVEKPVPSAFMSADVVNFNLNIPDFVTASRVAAAINKLFPGTAKAVDPATVKVVVPPDFRGKVVDFVAKVQEIEVVQDRSSKIVISERTGTIVMGADVRILPVAVSHGSLTVKIETTPQVSQPPAFSGGATVVTSQTTLSVEEQKGPVFTVGMGKNEVHVTDLINALNKIGASPRDIIAILRAIKAAGALEGDLEVM